MISFNELEIGAIFYWGHDKIVCIKVSNTHWYGIETKDLVETHILVRDYKQLKLLPYNLSNIIKTLQTA